MKLKTRFFLLVFLLLSLIGIAVSILGFFIIQSDIVERSKRELEQKLIALKIHYNNSIEEIKDKLEFITSFNSIEEIDLRKLARLDYLFIIEKPIQSKSYYVKEAWQTQKPAYGSRIITKEEMAEISNQLLEKAKINILETPKASKSDKMLIEDALVLECALPFFDKKTGEKRVIYAGRILNNDLSFIDKIHSLVFTNELYAGIPVGTITIFLNDIRIATNVLTTDKKRAIGSKLSSEVYEAVIKEGKTWRNRAFVVTDWYISIYEPIIDGEGNRIGVLYVGILERPFTDMMLRAFLIFLGILLATALVGGFVTFLLVQSVSRPLHFLVKAFQITAAGNYAQIINWNPKVKEIIELKEAFNKMIKEIQKGEKELKDNNERLEILNKSYLDLIGFVSHELKGILASTILNAYSVRDGYLGMVNFKQRKALDSITRNLDYLADTVKNFLSLSRIEKGELNLKTAVVNLKNEIIENTLINFERIINDGNFKIQTNVNDNFMIEVDRDLILIVFNNLIGNALKYGKSGGEIKIEAQEKEDLLELSIYNDGEPLKPEEIDRLFGKFSRLDDAKKRHIKGTGLGLYITKEIINQHGGIISCKACAHGNIFIITLPRRRHAETT